MESYSSNMVVKCSKHEYLWSGVYIYPVTEAGGCLLRVVWWCGTEKDVQVLPYGHVCSEYTRYAGAGGSWKVLNILLGVMYVFKYSFMLIRSILKMQHCFGLVEVG